MVLYGFQMHICIVGYTGKGQPCRQDILDGSFPYYIECFHEKETPIGLSGIPHGFQGWWMKSKTVSTKNTFSFISEVPLNQSKFISMLASTEIFCCHKRVRVYGWLQHVIVLKSSLPSSAVHQQVKEWMKFHLLDIVETARFRFQYGCMMKHFIKSNSQKDYIKLKLKKKELLSKGSYGKKERLNQFPLSNKTIYELYPIHNISRN